MVGALVYEDDDVDIHLAEEEVLLFYSTIAPSDQVCCWSNISAMDISFPAVN